MERSSQLSFVRNLRHMLFRRDGSALPYCAMEISIATFIAALAALFSHDEIEWMVRQRR